MHSGFCRKNNQHFKAKSLPFAPCQVGNSGLTDAENFRRLDLRQFLDLKEFPEISHKFSSHLKNCSFFWRKSQINKHIAGRINDNIVHSLTSNLVVSLTNQFDILFVRFSTLFLKRMKHINCISKLCYINDSTLTQYVYTNFFYTGTDNLHRLPIAWIKPTLNRMEFETSGSARFIRKVPKVVQTRSNEFQCLHGHVDII